MSQRWRALAALAPLMLAGSTIRRAHAGPPLPPPAPAHLKTTYARLPLAFEANRGQVEPGVRFLSRINGGTLSLTATEAVLQLPLPQRTPRLKSKLPIPSSPPPVSPMARRAHPRRVVLRMKLRGANAAPRVFGQAELPGKAHYLHGRDPRRWVTNVPTYAQVRCADVYRGIDLLYYGNQRQLEYDFVVRPGADPRRIQLAFTGAERLHLDATGDLVIRTAAGNVRWHRPFVYQEVNGTRRPISAHYVLHPTPGAQRPNARTPERLNARTPQRLTPPTVGFQIAAYDPHRPLVIDPVLLLSASYLGSAGVESSTAIALDALGNAYITGNTATGFTEQRDSFVTKLNPAGTAVLYTTVFGGAGFDTGTGIAIDALGRAVVSGQTASADFPTTPGAFQRDTDRFGQDAFVTKLNATGTGLVFSTLLSVLGDDGATGIALDAAGNAYLSGLAFPGDFLDVDAFVAKLDPTGSTLLYVALLGDAADDFAAGIAVDALGSAYATGVSQNPDFLDYDAFIVKLDPAGADFPYVLLLGGIEDDVGEDIAVDSAGNASVTGWTTSTDFPLANALQSFPRGGLEAFVCKINAAGTAFVFSTFLGGSGNDFGGGVAHDAAGNVYVTGSTDSDNFPTANPWPGSAHQGLTDAFVTKLSANGSRLIFSGYLGGGGDDVAAGIAVDAAGGAYVAGQTDSTDFPRVKPLNEALGGERDAFVAKVGDGTAPLIAVAAAPGANSNGWNNGSVTVTLTAADEADGSGVKEIVYALSGALTGGATVAGGRVPVTVTTEGITRVTYFARDNAGNAATAQTLTIRIDRTPPVVTASRSPTALVNGWSNGDVTVSFACSDALSGVAVCPPATVLSREGTQQSATGTAIDLAGNVASATVDGIRIDRTPPIVTYSGGGEYTVDQQVIINCSAVDGAAEFPSGLIFSTCQNVNAPAYTFGLGPHQRVAIASDRAGNTGSGATAFNIRVTFTSLCNLTSRFATNASVAAALCASLTAAEAAAGRGDTRAKAAALATYTASVNAESGRSLPADRAGVLTQLAGAL